MVVVSRNCMVHVVVSLLILINVAVNMLCGCVYVVPCGYIDADVNSCLFGTSQR
jgi:hypothetical protein